MESENAIITNDTNVSTSELAAVFGLTARRVQQLIQDGIIISEKKGSFNLCGSIRRYIDFITKDREITATEKERQDADLSIKKAKAIVSVLEAKELQGKMHHTKDVAAMTEDLIYTIRGMLLALPGRLAVDVAGSASPAEAAVIIKNEVYKLMEELSNYRYDAKKYEERVRERRSWDAVDKHGIDDE